MHPSKLGVFMALGLFTLASHCHLIKADDPKMCIATITRKIIMENQTLLNEIAKVNTIVDLSNTYIIGQIQKNKTGLAEELKTARQYFVVNCGDNGDQQYANISIWPKNYAAEIMTNITTFQTALGKLQTKDLQDELKKCKKDVTCESLVLIKCQGRELEVDYNIGQVQTFVKSLDDDIESKPMEFERAIKLVYDEVHSCIYEASADQVRQNIATMLIKLSNGLEQLKTLNKESVAIKQNFTQAQVTELRDVIATIKKNMSEDALYAQKLGCPFDGIFSEIVTHFQVESQNITDVFQDVINEKLVALNTTKFAEISKIPENLENKTLECDKVENETCLIEVLTLYNKGTEEFELSITNISKEFTSEVNQLLEDSNNKTKTIKVGEISKISFDKFFEKCVTIVKMNLDQLMNTTKTVHDDTKNISLVLSSDLFNISSLAYKVIKEKLNTINQNFTLFSEDLLKSCKVGEVSNVLSHLLENYSIFSNYSMLKYQVTLQEKCDKWSTNSTKTMEELQSGLEACPKQFECLHGIDEKRKVALNDTVEFRVVLEESATLLHDQLREDLKPDGPTNQMEELDEITIKCLQKTSSGAVHGLAIGLITLSVVVIYLKFFIILEIL